MGVQDHSYIAVCLQYVILLYILLCFAEIGHLALSLGDLFQHNPQMRAALGCHQEDITRLLWVVRVHFGPYSKLLSWMLRP